MTDSYDDSHTKGSTTQPLINSTIGDYLDRICQRYPDREAVVVCHQDIRKTYADLQCDVDHMAAGLLSLGLHVGDRVGIWSPNNYQWIVTQFATAKAGLILVTINPAYRLFELEYALNKVECKALVLADSFKSSNYIEMIQTLAPEITTAQSGSLNAARLPALNWLIQLGSTPVNGMLSFDDLYSQAKPKYLAQLKALATSLTPNDAVNIQFTSGTTGSPKGATLTHHNILNNGYWVAEAMRFTEQDRLCIPVPLYHCFGLVMGVLGCMTHGATVVLPSDAFDPECTLQAISQERCTACYGVPTMFIAMLDHPAFTSFDLSTLRTGTMAGAPCPEVIMKRVNTAMHMSEVTIAYGMTETSPVSFQSGVDTPFEQRVSTVGRVHPHVEVKLINQQGGCVAIGETGELCTRGYCVMQGYWGDPQRTAESIDSEGWMHTGDLATLDAQGYCRIVGRVKDMIIRGGENIYPREIEEFLFTHPAIQSVAVFGVPDKKYGEQVAAWIQLEPNQSLDEADIKRYCDNQIAHFKVPVYIRFVDSFPMTVTGKIQKFKMQEVMEQSIRHH